LSKLPSRISIDQIQVPVHLPGKEALEVTPNITFWQKLISGEITLKDCPEWAIQEGVETLIDCDCINKIDVDLLIKYCNVTDIVCKLVETNPIQSLIDSILDKSK